MNRSVIRITTLVTMVIVFAASANAALVHVPADQLTIAAGLAAAGSGDIVVVAAGTYHEHGLLLKTGVTLRGATGDPADVVIDGDAADRVLTGTIAIADVAVEAITVRNGEAAGGAGIKLEPTGSVTLSDCVFADNHSTSFGGGAYIAPLAFSGTIRFERCVFENNTAISQGGGAAVIEALTVLDCVFTRNASTNSTGGGLDQDGGDLLLADSDFVDNASRLSGGGVRADGGTARIQRCFFSGNGVDTGSGGGASVVNGIVGGTRFVSNTAGYHGGGLEASPLMQLAGCEFVGNMANSVAGGALVSGGTVSDCLFSGNGAGVNAGGLQFQSAGGTVIDSAFENNTALAHGGAFASIIVGGVYTFENCSFSGDSAPLGSEGWMASDATVTLICCVAEPLRWSEGHLIEDNADCPVASNSMSFGDLKRLYR